MRRGAGCLNAAEAELARLCQTENTSHAPPSFDAVLRAVSAWRDVLHGSTISAQREILAVLVQSGAPVRRSRGLYEAVITWTPVGQALREAVRATGAAVA